MENVIAIFVSQFPIIMTAFALCLGVIGVLGKTNRSAVDIFLGYLFFFAVGLSGLWGFIFHAFFPEMAAKFIGWENSPFQSEV